MCGITDRVSYLHENLLQTFTNNLKVIYLMIRYCKLGLIVFIQKAFSIYNFSEKYIWNSMLSGLFSPWRVRMYSSCQGMDDKE